jgi:prophage tail gpP-like protein
MTVSTEGDEVTVDLPQIGLRIERWKSYSVNQDFLTPVAGWSFELGDDETGDALLRLIEPGLEMVVSVNGIEQLHGHIDNINISTSRGGTNVSFGGRDLLARAMDAHIDPTVHFKPTQTLYDVLRTIFEPFGLSVFDEDNETNRAVMLGRTRGIRTSASTSTNSKKRRSKKKKKALNQYAIHQLVPYPSEGAFTFAARVAQQHGLWIWLGADGKTVVVGQPDFDQDPSYKLVHRRNGAGNMVISGSVSRSATDQPSCIVATCRGGGGAHPRAGMRVIAINGAVRADTQSIRDRHKGKTETTILGFVGTLQRVFNSSNEFVETGKVDLTKDPFVISETKKYPGAKVIVINEQYAGRYKSATARPLYLESPDSNTLEHLENFARREISLRQRKAFDVHYTVEGHAPEGGPPWTIDTIVDVDDEVLGIREPLYVLSRTFNKSRSAGTTTDLHLIRLNTLVF